MMRKRLTIEEIEKNYSIIGNGFNAAIFQYTKTHVIRATYTKWDGWTKICHIPEALREEYTLPRILDHWIDDKTKKCIAIVEKLYRIPYYIRLKNPVNLEIFNDHGDIPEVDTVMEKDNPFYQVTKNAVAAFHYCNEHIINDGKLCALDLNDGNIMMRETGELVLSDPFGAIRLKKE